MGDSTITRPAGQTGPYTRAALKGANKEAFVTPSVPWTITDSYKRASVNWGNASLTSLTAWPFLFGLPTSAAATSAIVIKRMLFGVSSNGVAGANVQVHLARATSVSGGTSVTTSRLRGRSTFSTSGAAISYGSTATKGAIMSAWPHVSGVASKYVPYLLPAFTYRRELWPDMLVLKPGEYIGLKYEQSAAAVNPNGNEAHLIHISWDEVTL